MAANTYVIGVDFGTLSGRAVLVEADTGRIAGQKEHRYAHGVMTRLPGGEKLADGWALQDPADYLQVLEETIPPLLREAGISGEQVAGLGCDVTSCTILPTLSDGTPLCRLEEYRDHPHAYVKIWKHHSAHTQAQRIESWVTIAAPTLLERYGAKVSSQWMLPKVLQILEEAPEVYRDAELILEAVDWLSFQLTGNLRRNTCCAGFKSFWESEKGYPTQEFFTTLDPRLEDLVPQKLRGAMAAPWEAVGCLTPEWAGRLGLSTHTAVASGIIDAHAGLLGCGITEAGRLMLVLGTSSCHVLLSPREVPASAGPATRVSFRATTPTRPARPVWGICWTGSFKPAFPPPAPARPGNGASPSISSSPSRRAALPPAKAAFWSWTGGTASARPWWMTPSPG